MRAIAIGVIFAAAMCGQGVGLPGAGLVRDAAGALREVQGVGGAIFSGKQITGEVTALAAADRGAWFVQADRLKLWTPEGEYDFDIAGPFVFGFDKAGAPALAWSVSEARLYEVNGRELKALDWKPEGNVRALAKGLRGEVIAVAGQESNAVLIDPAGRKLEASGTEIVVGELRFDVGFEVKSLEWMSSRRVAIRGGEEDPVKVLDLTAGRERVFVLAEASW